MAKQCLKDQLWPTVEISARNNKVVVSSHVDGRQHKSLPLYVFTYLYGPLWVYGEPKPIQTYRR